MVHAYIVHLFERAAWALRSKWTHADGLYENSSAFQRPEMSAQVRGGQRMWCGSGARAARRAMRRTPGARGRGTMSSRRARARARALCRRSARAPRRPAARRSRRRACVHARARACVCVQCGMWHNLGLSATIVGLRPPFWPDLGNFLGRAARNISATFWQFDFPA